jgi:hypothetical protein
VIIEAFDNDSAGEERGNLGPAVCGHDDLLAEVDERSREQDHEMDTARSTMASNMFCSSTVQGCRRAATSATA